MKDFIHVGSKYCNKDLELNMKEIEHHEKPFSRRAQRYCKLVKNETCDEYHKMTTRKKLVLPARRIHVGNDSPQWKNNFYVRL